MQVEESYDDSSKWAVRRASYSTDMELTFEEMVELRAELDKAITMHLASGLGQ